jgi:hypothetical protein
MKKNYGRAVYVANKEEQDLFKTTACPDCNGTGEIEEIQQYKILLPKLLVCWRGNYSSHR